MGSVSICTDMVATISSSKTPNICHNVARGFSRPYYSSLTGFPSGLANCSSRSSLFLHKLEILRSGCRDSGGCFSIPKRQRRTVVCAKDSDNGAPRPQYSSDAKIRSEVIAPFRALRMFFYGAFIASGSIGGLIATTRLIASLNNVPGAEPAIEIAKGLAIDVGAVVIFALLYRSDSKARDKSLARLSREENLSNLRLQLSNNKVVTLGELRGNSRIVILAGPGSYVEEALSQSEPFKKDLLERGVLVAAYATDGASVGGENAAAAALTSPTGPGRITEGSDTGPAVAIAEPERKWRATPIYTAEWGRWINEQKDLANVPPNKPVYISLRLDGRVRGSGVGIPPWQAMSLQLPPLKGIWGGALDGMDGRV